MPAVAKLHAHAERHALVKAAAKPKIVPSQLSLTRQLPETQIEKDSAEAFFKDIAEGNRFFVQFRLWINPAFLKLRNADGNNSLIVAAVSDQALMCDLLLEAGTSPQVRGSKSRTALHRAAICGHLVVTRLLISRDKKLIELRDCDQNTALLLACTFGHEEVCEDLLMSGANPFLSNQQGSNALHCAVLANNIKIARLLVKKFPSILHSRNACNEMAIHIAANKGFAEMCQLLINLGAKTDAKGNNGRNVVHYGVASRSLAILNLFRVRRSLFEAEDGHGHTSLTLAASLGFADICQWISINNPNMKGHNFLVYAVDSGCESTVQFFLDSAKELLEKDTNGNRALHHAAQGSYVVCKRLLEAGADIKARNKAGFTPLEIARNSGRADIVVLMVGHMFKIGTEITMSDQSPKHGPGPGGMVSYLDKDQHSKNKDVELVISHEAPLKIHVNLRHFAHALSKAEKEVLELEQMNYINLHQDSLRVYYDYFLRLLVGTRMACLCIVSGQIDASEKHGPGYLAWAIDEAGKRAGIPFVGIATKVLKETLTWYLNREEKIGAQRLALLFTDDRVASEELARIARKVTLTKEVEIRGHLSHSKGLLDYMRSLYTTVSGDDVDHPIKVMAIEDCKKILNAVKAAEHKIDSEALIKVAIE